MKDFLATLHPIYLKLFIGGNCSDVVELLDTLLTEDQKQQVISLVDECYTKEEQERIVDNHIKEMNR